MSWGHEEPIRIPLTDAEKLELLDQVLISGPKAEIEFDLEALKTYSGLERHGIDPRRFPIYERFSRNCGILCKWDRAAFRIMLVEHLGSQIEPYVDLLWAAHHPIAEE